jgi:hypothetical protein
MKFQIAPDTPYPVSGGGAPSGQAAFSSGDYQQGMQIQYRTDTIAHLQ